MQRIHVRRPTRTEGRSADFLKSRIERDNIVVHEVGKDFSIRACFARGQIAKIKHLACKLTRCGFRAHALFVGKRVSKQSCALYRINDTDIGIFADCNNE